MEKYMCYGTLGVAGLMLLIFTIDLILGFPFGGMKGFFLADIFGITASLIVGYLGFNAMRDLK